MIEDAHSVTFFAHCRCIGPDSVMGNSTRLLVTHQRQFLPLCDRIVLMSEGRIAAIGTWSELEKHPILAIIEQSSDQAEVIHFII